MNLKAEERQQTVSDMLCFMQQILNLPLDISVATCITCIYMEIINVLYVKIFVKVKNSRF